MLNVGALFPFCVFAGKFNDGLDMYNEIYTNISSSKSKNKTE